MLHKEEGGPVLQQQLLNLHPGEQVDIVQRLIPDIQVGALAQAGRDQHLFLLSGAVLPHIPLKERPGKAQLPQDGQKSGHLDPLLLRPGHGAAPQVVRLLGDIGNLQPRSPEEGARVGDLLPQRQPQQAGLARAVAPLQAQPVPLAYCKADWPASHTGIGHRQLPPLQQPLAEVGQGRQLQTVRPLNILEQAGLLLNGPFRPTLNILPLLLALPGLLPQIGPQAVFDDTVL